MLLKIKKKLARDQQPVKHKKEKKNEATIPHTICKDNPRSPPTHKPFTSMA
jgi:hypothetical protein